MSPTSEKPVHPTKAKLLETVNHLIDSEGFEAVGVERVLDDSGISRGSLYHHFEDFPDLVEQALVERFSYAVDRGIEVLSGVVFGAKSADDLRAGLRETTRMTQSDLQRPFRFERARLLGLAEGNDRLMAKLNAEQDRLTGALADLFREVQEKGWMNSEFDPKAGAIFIQAYTLGLVIDDAGSDQVDPESWVSLIDMVLDRAFGPDR